MAPTATERKYWPASEEAERPGHIPFMPIIEGIDKNIGALREQVEALAKAVASLTLTVSELKGDVKVMSERSDKNLAEYKAIASDIQGDSNTKNARVEGDIKAINARLDAQQTKFGWTLTVFGIIITVVIAAIQFLR